MAIKFQYNKTSLTVMDKALKMRLGALPTLQNKEAALRISANAFKILSESKLLELEAAQDRYDGFASLWNEFTPEILTITEIDLKTVRVAGVKVPELDNIRYSIAEFNSFQTPAWFADGINILKELSRLGIESEILARKSEILEYNRKKTTQKVNLYQKVQIPGYQEAIRKIKRFMEDEENLAKASQKIVKDRHAAMEEDEL